MSERPPHLSWFESLGMRPARPEALALARLLFFYWLACCNWRPDSALWLPFAQLDFRPPGFAALLGARFTSAPLLGVLDVVWVVLLLASALGICTRWVTTVSLLLGAYLLALPHGIGKVHHGDAIVLFVMAALALSRAGDAWSVDAWLARRGGRSTVRAPSVEYAWPISFTLLCLVAVYFAAGIAKLRTTGIGWAFNEGGRLRLIAHAYTHHPPTDLGLWLAEAGPAHQVMGAFALALELFCPLALISRPGRVAIVGGLFLLQLGIWLTLGVFFEGFFALFAICIPWLELWDFVRRAFAFRRAARCARAQRRP